MENKRKPFVFINIDALFKMKAEGGVSEENLNRLRAECDKFISEPTLKVTERLLKAPSGNPHDYTSMGTYWWPNPDTPDGLPYIRRDGYANPAKSDKNNPASVQTRCLKLALAALYFDEDKYAEYANRQLYDWYINPETYMAPHGKYVQAIPGICEGRGVGLIDFHHSYYLMDAVRILEALGKIDEATVSGVEKWFSDFTDWMLTTEIGINEANARNNHGSWYDSQIITAAAFLGRNELLKQVATTSYSRRIVPQIAPDGSQPHELARTMAFTYSLFNLKAMLSVAKVAARNGVSLYTENDPHCGKKLLPLAIDFLLDGWNNIDAFPYTELKKEGIAANFAEVLLEAGALFGGDYTKRALECLEVGALHSYFPAEL